MKLLSRILAATDFSAAAQLAVTRAGQLASQHGADLHLIHATPDWNLFSRWTSARQEHYDQVSLHAHAAMRDEVNRILSTFGVHARGEVQLGKASQVILRALASYQPSVLIMGARGEHSPRVSPAALGGTSLKLFLHCESPLLLVRDENASPYSTSIAAVHEASDVAKSVVLWGSSLVPGGDCHVVHAYEAPYVERMRLCGVDDAAVQASILAAEAAARASLDKVITSGAPEARVHFHLAHGHPLAVLVTEVARHGPQLVVVGRHESARGRPQRELLGSMALRMAYHTPVDVLVIP